MGCDPWGVVPASSAHEPQRAGAPRARTGAGEKQEGRPNGRPGRLGSGGRIRTCDLRVMSPTSYRTAPPRDVLDNVLYTLGRAIAKRGRALHTRACSSPYDLPIHCNADHDTRPSCNARGRAAAASSWPRALAALLSAVPATMARPGRPGPLESAGAGRGGARRDRAPRPRLASVAVEEYNVARAELDAAQRAAHRRAPRPRRAPRRSSTRPAARPRRAHRRHLQERRRGPARRAARAPGTSPRSTRRSTTSADQPGRRRTPSPASRRSRAECEALTAIDRARPRRGAHPGDGPAREARPTSRTSWRSARALLADLDARVKELIERQARLDAAAAAPRRAAGVDLGSINGSAAQIAARSGDHEVPRHPLRVGRSHTLRRVRLLRPRHVRVRQVRGRPPARRHPAGAQRHAGAAQPACSRPTSSSSATPASTSHVGIYIGNGLFIEAPHTGDVVKVSRLAGRGCTLACRYPIRLP